ncbi:MAG: hypothetical protein Q8M39_03040 [Sulfuricurvum sp.]|nr:hypothetical protein [Sulfuricurvum sp.]
MTNGSHWSKWDLHIHSPMTHHNNQYFGMTNEDFVQLIENNQLSVIGITNYYYFHENELEEIRSLIHRKGLDTTVLGNLEFRISQPNKDGEWINIHCIFAEHITTKQINDLMSKLPISQTTTSGKKIYCSKESIDSSTLDLSHITIDFNVLLQHFSENFSLYQDYIIAVCPNGYGGFRPDMTEGRSLAVALEIEKKGHLILGRPQDTDFFLNTIRYVDAVQKPVFSCSDAHKNTDIGAKFTWIKAKATFDGLKQTIYEPSLRVNIQETSPYLDYPKSFFSKITIERPLDVFGNEKLCLQQDTIELNRDLVAIIGGRGSGKSILLDHIFKTFNNNRIINNPRLTNISENNQFIVEYTKTDSSIAQYVLSNENYLHYVHITQSEVKQIIEEPDKFSKVIFDMLSISSEINKEILVELSDKVGIYLSKIDALSRYKIEEIESNKHKYEKFIEDLKNTENQALLDEFQKNEAKKTQIEKLKTFNNILVTDLQSFEISTNEKLQYVKNTYHELTNSIVTISEIQLASQAEELNAINETINQFINQLNEQNEEIKKKFQEAGFMQDISVLTSQLIDYERQLTQCMDELGAINHLQNDIATAKQNIKNSVELFKLSIETKQREMNEKWTILKTSSDPIQQEIKTALSENIILNSTIRFDQTNFYSYIDQHINGQRFRSSGGRSKIERIQNEIVNLQTLQDFLNLINGEPIINVGMENHISIYDFIEKICPLDDILYDTESKKNIFTSLISNIEKIVSLNAEVTIQDGSRIKAIDELSAGMKGTLYTKVKLLTNAFETPVIFDQPEDDLDNDFIMNNMVTLFRKLKKYRQIIIVTHNPNLVINADAEQVIIANNENEHISYKSGAIENKEIREQICQILEGGESAFKNRERKYNI